ncbi:endo alpha-1,4 polygalactosaminidase [Kutzneria albida]|uniref:Glycoside-hydrolase family GH114 TIM-barrel domain-containing protein n=1 Tax=Kutzneria albida DSM 43870 TaxID=1449976 RepID=W5WJK5_9PSEU|nr:endo alpha-1,4 polygalactosaminidase [Kutzneria albida]AHH98349.1 hypothetical protein KALB_4987 [Kutzneria albida DSM 43870]
MGRTVAAVAAGLLVVGGTLAMPTADASPGWWTPPAKVASWQWQLDGTIDTSVQAAVFDVDGFETSAATVAALHAKGAHVICYLDVGGAEPGRPDYSQFPKAAIGRKEVGWPEYYLDTRDATVRSVEAARVAMCASKGFDAVETDLDDTYLEGARATGFPLTQATGLDYLSFLAATVHANGLALFAKNGVDSAFVARAAQVADGEINEQCVQYSECPVLAPFGRAGKPVLHVEYSLTLAKTCKPDAVYPNFTSMLKRVALGAWRQVCP